MTPPYRVQEYVRDMGVYRKRSIIDGVCKSEYDDWNTRSYVFYVILPSNDPFGHRLPRMIRTDEEREKVRSAYEKHAKEKPPTE